VIIRNVSINGSLSPAGAGLPPLNTPRGTNGIRYIGGAQLTVENVTIIGFGTRGIEVALAAAGELTVRNTRITECAQGVKLTTSSGQLLASFDDLTLNNNSVPFGTTGNLLSTGNNRVEGNGGGAPPVLSTYTVR
jgi:hypothetical protein